jgi:MFS family permease
LKGEEGPRSPPEGDAVPSGRLLSSRKFLPFLIAGSFSIAAPSTVLVVLTWAVATSYPSGLSSHLSYSALALAFLGLSATIPTLAAALVSGTVADRTDRRWLMRLTNLVAVLASLGLVATLAMRPGGHITVPGPAGFYLPVWMVIAFPLWATVTAAATMFRPAFNASLPRLVASSALGQANGLILGFAVGISVAGSLTATAIVTLATIPLALLVPLALFLVTSVSLVGLSSEVSVIAGPPGRPFSADVVEGYRYLWRNRALLQVTFSALALNFLSALAFVELGLYVRDFLGVSEAILLGAMTTSATIGSGVGTVIMGRIRFERNAGRFLVVLAALQGVAILGLALSHTILISLPLMFVFGLFPGMSTVVFLATVQATVPNELLGRVFAADEVGSYGMVPPGQYAGGVLTLVSGVQVAYIVAGACTVGIGGLMATFRSLRKLGFVPKPEPPAAVATKAVIPQAPP